MAPSVAAHPIRVLHEAGVRVTVNADGPPPFATTVTEESGDPSRHAAWQALFFSRSIFTASLL
jgi:adenosine deaminase